MTTPVLSSVTIWPSIIVSLGSCAIPSPQSLFWPFRQRTWSAERHETIAIIAVDALTPSATSDVAQTQGKKGSEEQRDFSLTRSDTLNISSLDWVVPATACKQLLKLRTSFG